MDQLGVGVLGPMIWLFRMIPVSVSKSRVLSDSERREMRYSSHNCRLLFAICEADEGERGE